MFLKHLNNQKNNRVVNIEVDNPNSFKRVHTDFITLQIFYYFITIFFVEFQFHTDLDQNLKVLASGCFSPKVTFLFVFISSPRQVGIRT